jgi:hypothetical protein
MKTTPIAKNKPVVENKKIVEIKRAEEKRNTEKSYMENSLIDSLLENDDGDND